MAEQILFQWQDYLIVGLVLVISAGIGLYYALTGGRQRSTKEYLFANREVHWIPVSCSLLASWVSSLNLLSYPGEVYSYGSIFILGFAAWPIGILIASKFYLPVFYQLNVVSMFEYAELRFGKIVKHLVTWSTFVNLILYTGIVIYGPALSISAVTGMNLWLAVALVTGVSLLYTVIGGMKAVLWTDTLQLVIMVVGTFIVYITGVIKEGGFAEVYRVSKISGRLDIFDASKVFDFDPRARHTLWNLIFNNLTIATTAYGLQQASVQRALSLKSKKDLIKTYGLAAGIHLIMSLMCCSLGLIIYSHNRFCDPMADGRIFAADQYYPLYVMELFGHLPGMPGFILSAIFSGTLSTISSMISACATMLMADAVRPLKPNMTDQQATLVTKILSLVVGAISVVFVLFAKSFGRTLIYVLLTLGGVFGGPIFAVFSVGIFLPFVKRKGAISGFLIGAAYAGWLGFGNLFNPGFIYKYPVSTAGCNTTNTTLISHLTSPVYNSSTWDPQSHYRDGVETLYDISYQWVMSGAVIVCVLISIIVSCVFERKDKDRVDYRLISPGVINCYPQYLRNMIDFDMDKDEINPSVENNNCQTSTSDEAVSNETDYVSDEKGTENGAIQMDNDIIEMKTHH